MTKSIALKIDFKIDENNKLRIIDIGDGLAAGLGGFPEGTASDILQSLYQASGAEALVSILGELPRDAMQPQSIHIPLVFRKTPIENTPTDIQDLPSDKALLPYSDCARTQSYHAYLWKNQNSNIISPPPGLIATEMHKALWYALMDKHLAEEDRSIIEYWSNDTNPENVDLEKINMQHGVFIKIIDRSDGGGGDVYFAPNKQSARRILSTLHQRYNESITPFAKHIFVIEPAYVTIKNNYNVTGRAFIVLTLNSTGRTLDAKIIAAQWMQPNNRLEQEKTQENMLSNVDHSSKMQALSSKEIHQLRENILNTYQEVFIAGMTHNNLIEYCQDHPMIENFQSCIRPNSAYKLLLENTPAGNESLQTQLHVFVFQHYLKSFEQYLLQASYDFKFFNKPLTSHSEDGQKLINRICRLSFFENYTKLLKTNTFILSAIPPLQIFINKEQETSLKLTLLLKKYIQLSEGYDAKDLNRSLRQAAYSGNLILLKLLVYTYRADVNVLSPSSKTALDFFWQNRETKTLDTNEQSCLITLQQAGALRSSELQQQSVFTLS